MPYRFFLWGEIQLKNLEAVDDTLEELWLSYNQIERLAGVEKLQALRVLFLSNNKIKDWPEIEKLSSLEKLEDLLLVGNPLFNDYKEVSEYRIEVLKRLPNLKKLDGQPVDVDEVEAAMAAKGG
eukprot:TRINITY_DN5121_c0_g2_i1.p4 TRINITY_DN5121_c0_g2~~TRINITY_DN5121_c0_g2_i1.p4  ORF type:complete len:124 (-),score=32.48 TRINITY_DN5121_c0_g2_i1:133-504(-)